MAAGALLARRTLPPTLGRLQARPAQGKSTFEIVLVIDPAAGQCDRGGSVGGEQAGDGHVLPDGPAGRPHRLSLARGVGPAAGRERRVLVQPPAGHRRKVTLKW